MFVQQVTHVTLSKVKNPEEQYNQQQRTLQGPHHTALKSMITSFPSFDAFIMIVSTSSRVGASNTSPPLNMRVVSKQSLEVHVASGSSDDFGTNVGDGPETVFSGMIVFA